MPAITILSGGVPVAVIDAFTQMEWTRPYRKPGTFSVQIPSTAPAIAEIVKGRIVLPPDSTIVYLIEQILRENEDGSPAELWTVSGRDLGGFLQERLCLPTAGQAHDAQVAVAAESAMKHYVSGNAGPGAASARKMPGLTVAADLGRGATVTMKARYDVLADMLETIGAIAAMGWQVTSLSGGYIFDVIPGVDRSASVFFDTTFDTTTGQSWLSSDVDTKSYIYVGGQGLGAARSIVERYTGALVPTGLARRELFQDARDLPDTASLTTRGDAVLAGLAPTDRFEVQVAQGGSFQYRRDWDLGDLVTIRNVAWGLSQAARIVAVAATITPESALPRIAVTLDRPFPTLKDAMTNRDDGNGAAFGAVDTA